MKKETNTVANLQVNGSSEQWNYFQVGWKEANIAANLQVNASNETTFKLDIAADVQVNGTSKLMKLL